MQDPSFASKALEVNMRQTQMRPYELSTDHQWLITNSEPQREIYSRLKLLFQEYYHTYRNDAFVIETLLEISLTDLWFFAGLTEQTRAFDIIIELYETLMRQVKGEHEKIALIHALMKFAERLFSVAPTYTKGINRILDLIQIDFREHPEHYFNHTRLFKTYLDKIGSSQMFERKVVDLVKEVLSVSYAKWRMTAKPEFWYESKRNLLSNLHMESIHAIGNPFFDALENKCAVTDHWINVRHLMYDSDIANHYRNFAKNMNSHQETLMFLYYLLRLPGMKGFESHLVYDIHRNIRSVFKELEIKSLPTFIDTLMHELKQLRGNQGDSVLECLFTLGKEIILLENKQVIQHFIIRMLEWGFEYPGEPTIDSNWRIEVNPFHIKYIRTWMALIGLSPTNMRPMLSGLIVHLKLGGIFIADTDVFQRDVSKLLNTKIEPVYREVKQLARLFPIYFKDIGAEGRLRETSTAMDEATSRRDLLIHFLRKQIHTESNNTHIHLSRAIFDYWGTKNTEAVKGLLPGNVQKWLGSEPIWLEGVHHLIKRLSHTLETNPDQLLDLDHDLLIKTLDSFMHGEMDAELADERDRIRLINLIRVHGLLLEKYTLVTHDIVTQLEQYGSFDSMAIHLLSDALESGSHLEALKWIMTFMKALKTLILNPTETTSNERIFFKRHVAAGIPSMYGQYSEPKFEALGLIFRLEKMATTLMNRLIKSINLSYVTAKTLGRLYEVLELFRDGLALDGIVNETFNSRLTMYQYGLTSPSFSYDQYVNLFQFMARDIHQIIEEYFKDIYEQPLETILPANFSEESDPWQRMILKERFYAEQLTSAFLMADLDRLITQVLDVLGNMRNLYTPEMLQNMMTYNANTVVTALDVLTPELDNQVFLGTKAFFLKRLFHLGYPIPKGFVLTTEVFRHKETLTRHKFMKKELDAMILKQLKRLEKATGKRFGDPENPLLLSVRSGATFSMPGAMQTLLNVGMSDEMAEKMSAFSENGWGTWDNYRRLIQSLGMSQGIARHTFEAEMNEHKKRFQVNKKAEFSTEQMRMVAYAYKSLIEKHGVHLEQSPLKQLNQAIYAVLDSWHSKSADVYRLNMEISKDWGTAVLIQHMVFGNVSPTAGTGVAFTKNPLSGWNGINLYGDYVICGQGEDVVSGVVTTFPISEMQSSSKEVDNPLALEIAYPDIYRRLNFLATELIERHGFVHQEFEFTFESDKPEDLYILQIRNQKIKKRDLPDLPEIVVDSLEEIARGIGGGSGLLTGVVVFNEMEIAQYSGKLPLILIRPYTVPEDIPLIYKTDGLVTAKGGLTSHAAVAAAGLGKVCVVNCTAMEFDLQGQYCRVKDKRLNAGDRITINGYTGQIYATE